MNWAVCGCLLRSSPGRRFPRGGQVRSVLVYLFLLACRRAERSSQAAVYPSSGMLPYRKDMHHALHTTEVISSIASYAYWGRNDYDTPLDLRNVLALGLACRAFLEPALDQLWRSQLNVFNLIKTLPGDAWEVYEGDYRGSDGRRQLLIVSFAYSLSVSVGSSPA